MTVIMPVVVVKNIDTDYSELVCEVCVHACVCVRGGVSHCSFPQLVSLLPAHPFSHLFKLTGLYRDACRGWWLIVGNGCSTVPYLDVVLWPSRLFLNPMLT